MDTLFKYFSGAAVALLSLLAPVVPLISCVVVFIFIDFVTGVAADRAIKRKAGRVWYFESREAWRTVVKLGFTIIAIAMAWIVDCCLSGVLELNLAKLFTGFTCGVELWSFLENASQLSSSPIFVWMKRYVHHRLEEHIEKDE